MKIENTKRKIRSEITELSERLKQKKQIIQNLKEEISKLETPGVESAAKAEPGTWVMLETKMVSNNWNFTAQSLMMGSGSGHHTWIVLKLAVM